MDEDITEFEFQKEDSLVTSNGRINHKDSLQLDLGRSLLQETKDGNLEKVKNLVALGAPFTTDWVGTSPLHLAAYYNYVKISEVLLRAGIAQDPRNKVDRTPLHVACQMGNISIVRLLLAFSSDIGAKDMLWMTPLHWAAENGNTEVIKFLLNHGSPIYHVDKFGKSAIDISEEKANYTNVKLIQAAKDMAPEKRAVIVSSYKKQSAALARNIKWKGTIKNDVAYKIVSKNKDIGIILDRQVKNVDSNGLNRVVVTNTDPSNKHNLNAIMIKEEPHSPPPNGINSKTLQLLKEHGISMLEPDTGTVVSSAVESGQSIKLTEAGKLALISSKPGKTIIVPNPKAIMKVKQPANITAKKPNGISIPLNILASGKKVIQVNANELIKMATQKKIVIKQSPTSAGARTTRFLDGRIYTNLDQYIEKVKIKKQECEKNVEELRQLLTEKRNEIAKLNLMLYSAVKEKRTKI